MQRLPSSPGRRQALTEFEPLLLEEFNARTSRVNGEVRDAMHYALFSTADRFCASAAWMLGPRVGVRPDQLLKPLCAVETLRCSLALKTMTQSTLDIQLAEAASYGLIPLAFEMVLTPDDNLTLIEQTEIARTLASAASPVHVLSAMHREARLARGGYASRSDLHDIATEKAAPAFRAAGEIIELLSTSKTTSGKFAEWFQKLGVFAFWIDGFMRESDSPSALRSIMTPPEAMDMIKSLEVELLEASTNLAIRETAHEIIEPLADVLKVGLQ